MLISTLYLYKQYARKSSPDFFYLKFCIDILILTLNSLGFGAAWHLDYIEAEDMTTRKKYTFHCGKWLSKKEDDKQIVRELTCATRPLTPGAEDETGRSRELFFFISFMK